jgi:hypothetical protein
MFSMDLSTEYMQSCLAPMGAVPSLVLASGADEAVPDPSTIPTTAQRIAKAINAGEWRTLWPDTEEAQALGRLLYVRAKLTCLSSATCCFWVGILLQ